MLQDIKFAFRSLRQQRFVTLMVIACLALVVGGNTTVFSIFRSYILKPLPYPEVERLAMVWATERAVTNDFTAMSVADFLDFRTRTRVFERLEASARSPVNLSGEGAPLQLSLQRSTPGALPTLGASAQLGRLFTEADARPGAPPVLVLTEELWQTHFGADPTVIGRTVQLDKVAHEIVGVAGDFSFFFTEVDAWSPLVLDPAQQDRGQRTIEMILAKLQPGVSADQGREDVVRVADELESEFPDTHRGITATMQTFPEQFPGPTDRQLFSLLQGAGIFVLLIACANIANLLLARTQARQRELALRTALGAGRLRLFRQLITESLLLSLVGGGLGILLGHVGARTLSAALAGTLPKSVLPRVDGTVLVFSLVLSVGAGLIFGLAPGLAALRRHSAAALQQGGARGAVGYRRTLANVFVVAQVALALALLCGSGLLLYSFLEVQYGDQGFETAGILTFRVALPEADYPEEVHRVAFQREVLAELESRPQVSAAAVVTTLPRSRSLPTTSVTFPGIEQDAEVLPDANWVAVSPGYFETLGLTMLQGRGLGRRDRADAPPVVVVDESFAERFYGDRGGVAAALGERIVVHDESREIVGVISNVRQRRIGILDGPVATVYLPFAQQPRRAMSFLLRVRQGAPGSAAAVAQQTVWAIDPLLPVDALFSLDEHIAQQLAGIDVFSAIVGGFAGFALLLAALGLYGVLAYAVAQRTQEIGVRMAMGARGRDVLVMVLRRGALLTLVGLAIGAPMVFAVQRMVSAMLGDIAGDPLLLLPPIAIMLIGVAMLASFLPARRAANLAPNTALRPESA